MLKAIKILTRTDELLKDEDQSEINKPEFSQPILTALQVALVDLLRSFGIHAALVIGHSSGEIAAAYVQHSTSNCLLLLTATSYYLGAISAKSAWKIAYNRGAFTALLTECGLQNGAMMSVGLSEIQIRPYIDQLANLSNGRSLFVACINSHKNVTLSGDSDLIDLLKDKLKSEGIFAHKLVVGVAYHSPHMHAIARNYGLSIQDLEKGIPPANAVTMVSSITGQRVTADQLSSFQYWVDNMVSPVKFSAAVEQACAQYTRQIRKKLDCSHRDHLQVNFLLEIGPHSALKGPIRDILTQSSGGESISYASVLIRSQQSLHSMLNSLGQLHCLGYTINMDKVNLLTQKCPRLLHDLPEYPFDHSRRHWEESRISKNLRLHPQNKLDLLGKPVPDWNPLEARWRNFIRVSEMPWVEDHMVSILVLKLFSVNLIESSRSTKP